MLQNQAEGAATTPRPPFVQVCVGTVMMFVVGFKFGQIVG
jgi:hypothetical protein